MKIHGIAVVVASMMFPFLCPNCSLPFTVAKQAGSPLQISGEARAVTLRYDDGRQLDWYFSRIELKNTGAMPMLLVIVGSRLEGFSETIFNNSNVLDYYFEPKLLQPGKTEAVYWPKPTFGNPQVADRPLPPEARATARTAFVQFEDGTTWGDAAEGKEFLRSRAIIEKELRRLLAVASEQGPSEFTKQLLQSEPRTFGGLSVIDEIRDAYAAKKDPQAALDKLKAMLQAADEHRARLTASTAARP